MAGHRNARRLDRSGRDPSRLKRLQTIVAKSELASTLRLPSQAALLNLAVFCSLRLQHPVIPADLLGSLLAGRAQPLVADLRIRYIACEHPNLDPDHAIGGLRFREAEVNPGT